MAKRDPIMDELNGVAATSTAEDKPTDVASKTDDPDLVRNLGPTNFPDLPMGPPAPDQQT